MTDTNWDWFWPDGKKVGTNGKRLAFDIETNGLLPEVDRCWSLCIRDIDSQDRWSCSSEAGDIEDGLRVLAEASMIVGHNIIGYDIPVLKHLYPEWDFKGIARDTLVMAKMIWPMELLKELDFPRWRREEIPGQLIGAQKLEAWGYRMGLQKGEYVADVLEHGKALAANPDYEVPEELLPLVTEEVEAYGKTRTRLLPWRAWNGPMQRYCDTDVDVTVRLFSLIEGHFNGTGKAAKGVAWSPSSVVLEHDVWEHCLRQEAHGFGFDLESAVELAADLKNRQAQLNRQLREVFGEWWEPQADPKMGTRPARDYSEVAKGFPEVTLRRYSEKTGKELKPYVGPPKISYSVDAPFVPIKRVKFNPKSRAHLGKRLQDLYGWQPTEFGGKNGDQAKVDETTISEISTSILSEDLKSIILEDFVVSKTLGQLADGNKAWINLVSPDGRIHGRVDPLGTVSHRGAHKDPNLGQVASVSVEEKKDANGEIVEKTVIWGWKGGFGAECRSLFRPGTRGWTQSGTDASGLELRMLGHYLWPYDNGEFARRVSTPGLDIHAENAKITGLSRAETKTTTYAFLYGAGNLKLGLGVGVEDHEIEGLITSGAAKSYLKWLSSKTKLPRPDDRTLALTMRGAEVKKKFLAGITGLKDLQQELQKEGEAYGFIVAIDGRKLSIRKSHATLNQALQGGGAIVCKKWMLIVTSLLEDQGMVWGKDFGQMAWVHDELQIEHRIGLEAEIAEASTKAMQLTAASLDFRGELASETKHGSNWMDCH